jgi:hypothetical protein
MRYALLLLAALPLALATTAAELTPTEIQAALDSGAKAKKLETIEIKKGRVSCYVTTPTSRVQYAGHRAKKEYKTLAVADVAPELLAPEVQILCGSTKTHESQNTIADVKAIVIVPKGGEPIQPTSKEVMPEMYRNAYGPTAEGEGMMASFPLDAFKQGSVVHVVYSTKVFYSNFAGAKDDLDMEIKATP